MREILCRFVQVFISFRIFQRLFKHELLSKLLIDARAHQWSATDTWLVLSIICTILKMVPSSRLESHW